MAIEASAYRYLIEKLQPTAESAAKELPFVFVKGAVAAGSETFSALLDFLAGCLSPAAPRIPPVIGFGETDSNSFATLFRLFIEDVTVSLSTGQPAEDAARLRNTELTRLILDSSRPQSVRIVDVNDPISLAFLTFFLETAMHFGWCPNTLECQAKRSAHILFNALKKSVTMQDDDDLVGILCWLWGAWLFSQKTEGVAERKFEQESGTIWHEYQFSMHGALRSFAQYHTQEGSMGILEKSAQKMQPFHRFSSQPFVGMDIRISEEQHIEWHTVETNRITQKKAFGSSLVLRNSTQTLTWTTAIIVFGQTTYRVDVLTPASGTMVTLTRVLLTMESPGSLIAAGKGFCAQSPVDGLYLELIDNPFGLQPAANYQHPFALLTGSGFPVRLSESMRSVIAWTRGKDAASIEKTSLLGIYDAT